MPLFTVVLDHRGGTYISQYEAPTARAALQAWALNAPALHLPHIGRARADRFRAEIRDPLLGSPISVHSVRNVWCLSAIIAGRLALFHIIATAVRPKSSSRPHNMAHAALPGARVAAG